jgi:hypothetical protein
MERTSDSNDTLHEQIRVGSLRLTIDKAKPTAIIQEVQPQDAGTPSLKAKLHRSRYALAVAIASLAWLAIGLLGVIDGIHHVHQSFDARLQATEIRHQALETEYGTVSLIEKCLESVQSNPLQRRPFETHNACLARAINNGHNQFLGLPYEEYPTVVNNTVDWAEDSCSRLVFAPQIPMFKAQSLFWRSLDTLTENTAFFYQWARNADIESVVQSFKSIAKWLTSKLQLKTLVDNVESLEVEDKVRVDNILREEIERVKKAIEEAVILQLPPNYAFKCREDSVCRLTHTSHSSNTFTTLPMLSAPDAAISTIVRLRKHEESFAKLSAWLNGLLLSVMVVKTTCMLSWFLVAASAEIALGNVVHQDNEFMNRLAKQESRTLEVLGVQIGVTALSMAWMFYWPQLNALSSYDWSVLAVLSGILGASMLIIFFVPCGEGQEGISSLGWVVKDLFNAWFSRQGPMPSNAATISKQPSQSTQTHNCIPFDASPLEHIQGTLVRKAARNKGYETEPAITESRSVSSDDSTCISYSGRLLPSATSLFEDIEKERIIMHMAWEQTNHEHAGVQSSVVEWAEQVADESDPSSDADDDEIHKLEGEKSFDEQQSPESDSDSDWFVV